MKQMEIEYKSSDPKTAKQIGIRWDPEPATPEQLKEWHDTDGKYWADKSLSFVAIASIIQFSALAFMLITMGAIQFYMEIQP